MRCVSAQIEGLPPGWLRDPVSISIQSEDAVPYDLIMVLALHDIWKSRMVIRHRDIDAKWSKEYFSESYSSDY